MGARRVVERRAALEGVVAADSAISTIDGTTDELRYRGYAIDELCEKKDFVDVASLLWRGELPTGDEHAALDARLRAHRRVGGELAFLVHGLATRAEPMAALRTLVSALAAEDPMDGDGDGDEGDDERRVLRVCALLPTLVAAIARVRAGETVVPPDPELDLATNFLYMLRAERPDPREARVLERCLTLHAEHGLAASTFAARVTASTRSDVYAAVTSAIGTLGGRRHGGGSAEVLRVLREIGEVEGVPAWLEGAVEAKRPIPGFGHLVYRAADPRARVLAGLSREAGELAGERAWFRISERVAGEVGERLGLTPNVAFYAASAYHCLGVPSELFTPVFAMARAVGWTAHVLEQYADDRPVRPRARTAGPGPRDI